MSSDHLDRYTGHRTTDHEWNGIRELNTKVPRLLLWCLALTFIYSVISWVLLPAWPSQESFTRGLLQTDQKLELRERIQNALDVNQSGVRAFMDAPYKEILEDDALLAQVDSAGPSLFGDNCMACHGEGGAGSPGFPRLNDAEWQWTNSPDEIEKTLRHGINTPDPASRQALMPAFGKNGVLASDAITDVAQYVQSFSNPFLGDGTVVERSLSVKRGKAIYTAQCAACHGSNGQGNRMLGAPRLSDTQWLYGGDLSSVVESVHGGRAGIMPGWLHRLTDYELKILSLYVLRLSQAQDEASTDG